MLLPCRQRCRRLRHCLRHFDAATPCRRFRLFLMPPRCFLSRCRLARYAERHDFQDVFRRHEEMSHAMLIRCCRCVFHAHDDAATLPATAATLLVMLSLLLLFFRVYASALLLSPLR